MADCRRLKLMFQLQIILVYGGRLQGSVGGELFYFRWLQIKTAVDSCNHSLKYFPFLFCDSGFLLFLPFV